VNSVRLFLHDIRIEHTLFALPFAYVGAVMGARGIPSGAELFWITLAVIGARTAAMAANRFLDRKLDAKNPRTASRPTASGALPPSVALWAIALGMLVTLIAAWQLNPLCVALFPVAALAILIYPLTKRFTWSAHFVLGAVDGLAPLGAFVAVTGTVTVAALLLFVAVTIWVAGFDILYALMDYDVDVAQRLRSIPVRFGTTAARSLPVVLHVLMAFALLLAGYLSGAGEIYYAGVVLAVLLAVYESRLIAPATNVFALNDRIFATNMAFSVCFLLTTAAGYATR
jgi:4-hydroxybenzoate polyprenyltransferase